MSGIMASNFWKSPSQIPVAEFPMKILKEFLINSNGLTVEEKRIEEQGLASQSPNTLSLIMGGRYGHKANWEKEVPFSSPCLFRVVTICYLRMSSFFSKAARSAAS